MQHYLPFKNHRDAVVCCFLEVEWGGAGGGVGGGVGLSSRTKAQLQRDIVHLSQISCLCNYLCILNPLLGRIHYPVVVKLQAFML